MKKVLLASMLLLPVSSSWAVQNIKFGGVAINPTIDVQQSYDDNIYLTGSRALPAYRPFANKSSNINRSSLGIQAEKPLGSRLDLTAGYTFEVLTYSRAPGINNAVHNLANVGLKADLPRNSTLAIKDDYMHTTDQATSELTARAERIQNTADINLESPLRGNFGYGIDVQHTYHNYLASQYNGLDRQEVLAGVNVSYKLQPKTKVYLGYTYGKLTYAENTVIVNGVVTHPMLGNSEYGNVDLGVTGNIAPKLVGVVSAGVQFRGYDKSLASAANGVTTGDYSAQLLWKPLEKTEAALFAKRANIESVYLNSRYYTSTLTDLSASREINKFKVGAGVSFEAVDYPEVTTGTSHKRFDQNATARVTVDYYVQKWLKAGVAYSYKNRFSNESANNYTDNIVGVDVKGMF